VGTIGPGPELPLDGGLFIAQSIPVPDRSYKGSDIATEPAGADDEASTEGRILENGPSVDPLRSKCPEVLLEVRSVPMKQNRDDLRMRIRVRLDLCPDCRHNQSGTGLTEVSGTQRSSNRSPQEIILHRKKTMNTRRTALAVSILGLGAASTLSGCVSNGTSIQALRNNPTPELQTLGSTRDMVNNRLSIMHNQFNRALAEDIGRTLLLIDRPTRLTPSPVAY
jgi:hypothetical protein